MGCVIGGLACCFCSTAASLCCSCLPSCKSSTSTRLMYGLILILGTVLCCLLLEPNIKNQLAKIPALCKPYTILKFYSGFNCNTIAGFGAVYRVCFGLASFYFLLCVIMIRVASSKDPRSKIQNGFWFFKYLLLILIIVAAFFIPSDSSFVQWWLWFGLIGGATFIIIQLIFLVDFAHRWNESWVDSYEEDENKAYYIGLILFTSIFYVGSLVSIVFLFILYAGHAECALNKFFISFNLILCFIMIVISILPKVHEHMPKSGLLQSSMLTLYTIYLTWSAMTNGPNVKCNPSLILLFLNKTEVQRSTTTVSSVVKSAEQHFSWTVVIGLAFFIITVIYSSIRNSSHMNVGRLTSGGSEMVILPSQEGDFNHANMKDKSAQNVYDNEQEMVAYNYSFMHLMFLLGSLYIMMTLTNWYEPSGDLMTLNSNYASVWIKISSSWVCIAIYIWTMVAPCCFPDRSFN